MGNLRGQVGEYCCGFVIIAPLFVGLLPVLPDATFYIPDIDDALIDGAAVLYFVFKLPSC